MSPLIGQVKKAKAIKKLLLLCSSPIHNRHVKWISTVSFIDLKNRVMKLQMLESIDSGQCVTIGGRRLDQIRFGRLHLIRSSLPLSPPVSASDGSTRLSNFNCAFFPLFYLQTNDSR